MTLALRYLPAAIADLDAIWDYSAQNWDEDQADRYLGQLRDRINELTTRPSLGMNASWVRPNFRRLRAGSHNVYYGRTPI
jgi:toxin ParE1/3/4